MQGREAGVGPAALELNEQCLFGGAGEVARTFEGAVSAAGALFFLEERIDTTESNQLMTGNGVSICFGGITETSSTHSKISLKMSFPAHPPGTCDTRVDDQNKLKYSS